MIFITTVVLSVLFKNLSSYQHGASFKGNINIFHFQVQHPTILEINRRILGDDCQLGSIASNTIFPGGSGQEPHIDYPYWDYYDKYENQNIGPNIPKSLKAVHHKYSNTYY